MQNNKLKKQTSLFEWFISPKLNYITDVLFKAVNNTDDTIVKPRQGSPGVCIDDTIVSGHYTYSEFKAIYLRRRDRLLDVIRRNRKLLFLRFEAEVNRYTHKDIEDFIAVIKLINPLVEDVKLLLITPNTTASVHPSLITVFYNKHGGDPYCTSKEINELFLNSLETIGYNINDILEATFTDKSEV
jgi:hypothetical protein